MPYPTQPVHGLDRVDFEDSAVVAVPDAGRGDALWWAGAVFEGAQGAMRRFLRLGWRALLVQLGPLDSPGHVLGWPVASVTDRSAVLASRSRLGLDVRLVFQRTDDQVAFATFIRYTGRCGAVTWAPVAPLHRLLVRRLLRGAARRTSDERT
jgi:hypothetical protein